MASSTSSALRRDTDLKRLSLAGLNVQVMRASSLSVSIPSRLQRPSVTSVTHLHILNKTSKHSRQMQIIPAYDSILILICQTPQHRDAIFENLTPQFDLHLDPETLVTSNVQKLCHVGPTTQGEWCLSVGLINTKQTLLPMIETFFREIGMIRWSNIVETVQGNTTRLELRSSANSSISSAWLKKLWIGNNGNPVTTVPAEFAATDNDCSICRRSRLSQVSHNIVASATNGVARQSPSNPSRLPSNTSLNSAVVSINPAADLLKSLIPASQYVPTAVTSPETSTFLPAQSSVSPPMTALSRNAHHPGQLPQTRSHSPRQLSSTEAFEPVVSEPIARILLELRAQISAESRGHTYEETVGTDTVPNQSIAPLKRKNGRVEEYDRGRKVLKTAHVGQGQDDLGANQEQDRTVRETMAGTSAEVDAFLDALSGEFASKMPEHEVGEGQVGEEEYQDEGGIRDEGANGDEGDWYEDFTCNLF